MRGTRARGEARAEVAAEVRKLRPPVPPSGGGSRVGFGLGARGERARSEDEESWQVARGLAPLLYNIPSSDLQLHPHGSVMAPSRRTATMDLLYESRYRDMAQHRIRNVRSQMIRLIPTKADLEKRSAIVLTQRDRDILVALYVQGFLTTRSSSSPSSPSPLAAVALPARRPTIASPDSGPGLTSTESSSRWRNRSAAVSPSSTRSAQGASPSSSRRSTRARLSISAASPDSAASSSSTTSSSPSSGPALSRCSARPNRSSGGGPSGN